MVDMHIHTNNSDGSYSTEEIVEMLRTLKAEMFSITDHDSVDACKEIEKLDIGDMIYIPGIELSSKNGMYDCHILGYYIDYNNEDLIRECELIRSRRLEKIDIILNYLQRVRKVRLSEEEKLKIYGKKGTIGRYDICKVLMDRNIGSKKIIYDRYLTNIKGIPSHRSEIDASISAIKKARGIPVLAHPKEIEQNYNINIEDIIEDFIEKGIEGIEVYNSIHNLREAKKYLALAKKYNLLITGGSDFHGESHPDRKLGRTTMYKVILNSSNLRIH